MSNNEHRSTDALDLFGGMIEAVEDENVTALERYARILGEIFKCKAVWIDAPARMSARHPRVRKASDIAAEDLLPLLFPGGYPSELTILGDLTEVGDPMFADSPAKFLIAAPLKNSTGITSGVVAVLDTKPRKLTADQVDAFKDILRLAAQEVERNLPLAVPSTEIADLPDLNGQLALSFVEQCPYPVWIISQESLQVLAANKAAQRQYGYTNDEIKTLTASDLLSGEENVQYTAPAASPRRVTHRSKDGYLIEAEILSLNILYEGSPARLDMVRDIANWRRVEDRSRFQSSVLSQISDAVITLDLDYRVTYWNHVAEQMYDLRASEVLGERIMEVVQPIWTDKREEEDAATTLLSQGRWAGETVQHRRDGEMLHVESTVTAIKNSENRQIGFLCLNRDITDRKKMEMSLLQSEQRHRSLFDFHPDAVVWIDLDGKFLSANLACMSILGYMPDDLVGKPFLPLIDAKNRVGVLGMFDKARHGEPANFEYIGLHKSGRKVQLSAVALPVIVDAAIVGVYMISQDCGERKRLQSVIAGENEVLQWLAAGNPLRRVIDGLIANIEDRYDAVTCTVLVLDDENNVDVVSAPHAPEAALTYLEKNTVIRPNTTTYEAIGTSKQVFSSNIHADPATSGQREFAALLDAKAACSTPIISSKGDVLGTFTMYLDEPRRPTVEELNISDRAATLLRIAIESDRAHLRLSLTERAMDSTVASVVITDPNKPNQPITYVNQAFERITGYRADQVIGRSMSFLHGPETDPQQLAEIERTVSRQRECNVLVKYRTADNRPYWSSSSISPVRDPSGKLTHYIEVQNDVTTLMEALDAVRDSEQRFRQLIENASDMVLVLEESGLIRYISPAVERICLFQPQEIMGRDLFEFIHPEDLVLVRTMFLQLLDAPDEVLTVELRCQRKDETWCHLEMTCQNLINKPGVRGIVVNAHDLSERKLANDRLDHLAYHDVLTDLPNRLLFNEHLTKSIANARRRSSMIAVLFLDLDRFKIINDTLGHSVGDELLQNVAARLTSTAREGDTVARWGGDEFTLILGNVGNSRDASRAAQRIIQSLSEPFHLSGHELYITATVGISMFPAVGDDVETLVRHADTAMYRAKEEGQNHYQFYTPKMNAGAGERLALESRLRRALEREEFTLHYQPQIDSKTGRIVSAEALVRWQHPEMGLVPPKDFIPLAEETGLIIPIGDWIMRSACSQAHAWQDAGYEQMRVALNLSARQFSQRDLQQMVMKTIRETGADPCWIELELTESLLINCENRVINAMKDLAALGVSVTIDDFGVGYSSYSYLKRYPVSALKIEQSFVRGMLVDAHDNAIVQSIIAMAHKLNLHVIAEGIESKAQSDTLVASQCDLLQGYFYGRPMPVADFTKMLDKQRSAKAA